MSNAEANEINLDRLRNGDVHLLEELYRSYLPEFKGWMRKHHTADEAVLEDAFQDAVVLVYTQAKSGELNQLSASLKTYVFGVAHNKLRNTHKKARRTDYLFDLQEIKDAHLVDQGEGALEHLKDVARIALRKLGERCRQLLTLYYVHEYDMDSIARELELSGRDSAKTQKAKCMHKLKGLVQSITSKR